ncbi:unnamed protein product [Auanema sp. JU1783]|nr:unnamed protein product [Auanema sp. JU1783]
MLDVILSSFLAYVMTFPVDSASALELVSSNESSTHMMSKLWCPTFIVGTICPDHTLLSYYKCCGRLHKHCCSHLRLWVLILIIGLPILFLIPPIIYLLRRILCKKTYTNRDVPAGPNPAPSSLQPVVEPESNKDTSL